MKNLLIKLPLVLITTMLAIDAFAATAGLQAITVTTNAAGQEEYSISIQVIALMTFITLIPSILLMMTSFTRIIIVLAILRQATGLMQAPPSQVVVGLALFLTLFIMAPVFDRMYVEGVKPYMNEEINAEQALEKVAHPLHQFMMAQTREKDLIMFTDIAKKGPYQSKDDVPFSVLVPAFVTSELKTAFSIGFMLFIPFLIIDLVVASVLMSMGMMMLSPLIVSLPFKIMLFVLADGWSMVMGTLASSFYV